MAQKKALNFARGPWLALAEGVRRVYRTNQSHGEHKPETPKIILAINTL